MARRRAAVAAALALALPTPGQHASAEGKGCNGGLFPDLPTVVPKHLAMPNPQQRETPRFTNGTANRGDGPWRLRPKCQGDVAVARQEILDAHEDVACSQLVGTYVFHPEHHRWHIDGVARYEGRAAQDNGLGGTRGGARVNDLGQVESIKTTFCLMDWYKLDDNAPTTERVYRDRARDLQGISVGRADQYHQSLEGQQIDLTGVPESVDYITW